MITKDDVKKALTSLEGPLSGGDGDDLEKGGARAASSGKVPKDGDLNSSNGAADGGGSLDSPGQNMNDKHDNKKGSKNKMGYAKSESGKVAPDDFGNGLPGEIETKVDVSNFLKSLVDHTAESHDALRDYLVKSDIANDSRYEELAEHVEGVTKSLANVGVVLKAICQRIGVIENEPQVKKSQVAEEQVVERQIQKSDPTVENANQPNAGDGKGDAMYKSLHGKPPHIVKSLISEKLCDLVKAGKAQDLDVINFETYNHVSPELDEQLRQAFA